MVESDLPQVLQVEESSFPLPWTEEGFREELSKPFSYLYVARAVDSLYPSILGYVCLWILMDELHILNLAVHPAYRRQGIGSRLLRFSLRLGKAAKVEVAALEVRPSNEAAINLYKEAGFVEMGRRRHYYSETNEDAIIMELNFNGT